MRNTALAVLAAFLLLALSGCASTGFLGFLATTKQVDQKLAEQSARVGEELTAEKAELGQLKRELEEIRTLKEQARTAVEQMARTQAAVDELRASGGRVEERLAALPAETLKWMIDILQNALDRE